MTASGSISKARSTRSNPDEYWKRYLYFNAGFFFYRCPRAFGQRFLDYALTIRDDPPPELVCQSLDPWLDQVALPLVIHSLGGGRDTLAEGWLDGAVTCHYRALPLLYARESDRVVEVLEEVTAPNRVKKVLKTHEPAKRYDLSGPRAQGARALRPGQPAPARAGDPQHDQAQRLLDALGGSTGRDRPPPAHPTRQRRRSYRQSP